MAQVKLLLKVVIVWMTDVKISKRRHR